MNFESSQAPETQTTPPYEVQGGEYLSAILKKLGKTTDDIQDIKYQGKGSSRLGKVMENSQNLWKGDIITFKEAQKQAEVPQISQEQIDARTKENRDARLALQQSEEQQKAGDESELAAIDAELGSLENNDNLEDFGLISKWKRQLEESGVGINISGGKMELDFQKLHPVDGGNSILVISKNNPIESINFGSDGMIKIIQARTSFSFAERHQDDTIMEPLPLPNSVNAHFDERTGTIREGKSDKYPDVYLQKRKDSPPEVVLIKNKDGNPELVAKEKILASLGISPYFRNKLEQNGMKIKVLSNGTLKLDQPQGKVIISSENPLVAIKNESDGIFLELGFEDGSSKKILANNEITQSLISKYNQLSQRLDSLTGKTSPGANPSYLLSRGLKGFNRAIAFMQERIKTMGIGQA